MLGETALSSVTLSSILQHLLRHDFPQKHQRVVQNWNCSTGLKQMMVYLSQSGAIYIPAFDFISVYRRFHFSPAVCFLFFLVCLFLSPLSCCQAFGSETAWSITTRRCISSISSFCFVKQPPNQYLVFLTHGLDNRQQLPSVLVREPVECRINSQSSA